MSKRSRWSDQRVSLPGISTILPQNLNDEQTKIYLLKVEIQDLVRRIRRNQYNFPDERPSPEPICNSNGKRSNNREVQKKLGTELRCYEKIQDLLKLKPDYKPPADYRPPNNIVHEKVWIPQDEHCEINFVGLLRGPKGNTLKALEIETGTSIIIRGKGLRRDEPLPGANEPIHAYITATDPTVLKAVSEKIKSILDDALNGQDGGNTLKRNQMSELALLNGTYKAKGGTHCSNCDSDQHKTYECSKAPNLTANIVCISCGGSGHVATDCLTPRTGYRAAQHYEFDNEYDALLDEINGNLPKSKKTATRTTTHNASPFRLSSQKGHPIQQPFQPQFQRRNQQLRGLPRYFFFPSAPPFPIFMQPPLRVATWMLPPPPPPPPPMQMFRSTYFPPPPPRD